MSGVPLRDRKKLTLEAALQISAAAEAEAKKLNLNKLSIAIVDETGCLLHFIRMDDADAASAEIAVAKARASAMFGKPTKYWGDMIAAGRLFALAMPNVIAGEGGISLVAGGHVIGGIGAAGATGREDGLVAEAGAALLA
jgi:glc operon protein GlcG